MNNIKIPCKICTLCHCLQHNQPKSQKRAVLHQEFYVTVSTVVNNMSLTLFMTFRRGTILHRDYDVPRLLSTRTFMRQSKKKFFQKKVIKFFFSKKLKNFFYCILAKFYFLRPTNAICDPRSDILRHTSMSCLNNLGTCSNLQDVSWLF